MPSLSLRLVVLLLGSALGAGAAVPEDPHAALRFFESQIRPILANRCYECHGEKKQRGGLRLDTLSEFKLGGDSGPAIVAGDPDGSLLVEAIRYKNPDFEMPPKKPLPKAEVELLEKWVALGAPWPEIEGQRPAVAVESEEPGFTEQDRQHWAFQPVVATPPPELPGNRWVRNEIDRFVASQHAELKLEPAAEADRLELVRRVYLNLHGLPPTPEQAAAFVDDPDPQAYEKLIDTLLASPRYGERWAQHWLDLVRYAESDGYRQDAYRDNAWPYRDWVVKSLNEDLPYTDFVRLQLAGDEIAPDNPEILVATSYLRNGIYEYNLRDVRSQLNTILTDITDVTGEVFLGLSFSCARCHDHKFDPILQKDYFSLRAFFEPVVWRTDLKLATEEEMARHAEKQAAWLDATTEIRAQIDALVGEKIEAAVQKDRRRYPDDIYEMMNKPVAERTPLEKQLVAIADRMPYGVGQRSPLGHLKTNDEKRQYQALLAELKKFDAIKPEPLLDALVATDVGPEAPPTLMKTRRGEQEIAPAFLTILDVEAPDIQPRPNSTGRRTALADWITRPDNPLSTRVIVNRIWQYHFGRGLAATASDFGNLGEKPTHPELLDWLTRRFVDDGWSLKKLHKLILLSATYRQTARRPVTGLVAQIDPGNRYLWRFSPRRLEAEQVRDAMLLASGELDLTPGGPSTDADKSTRRSIYTIKKRNSQNELLRALDAPAGFASTSERPSTTTPTQALLFFNADWPLTRAQRLASTASSVDDLWLAILGRRPTSWESDQAEAFLRQRMAEALPLAAGGTEAAAEPGRFQPGTPHERLIVRDSEREGEDFTIEAIIQVNSLDPDDGIRSIASRWDGGRNSLESCGWSFGITGAKSRHRPGSLLIQFLGENENANFAYEVAASDLAIDLKTPYYVSAYISSSDHSVTFRIQNLRESGAPLQTKVVKRVPLEKIGVGASPLILGGLNGAGAQLFDGHIEALRVAVGPFPPDLSLDPQR